MFCPNCEKNISTDYQYCPYCGIKLKRSKYHKLFLALIMSLSTGIFVYWWYHRDIYYFEQEKDSKMRILQDIRIHRAKEKLFNKRYSYGEGSFLIPGLALDMTIEELFRNKSNLVRQQDKSENSYSLDTEIDIFPQEFGRTSVMLYFDINDKLSCIDISYDPNFDVEHITKWKESCESVEQIILSNCINKYGRKYIEFNKDSHYTKGYPYFREVVKKDREYRWFYHNQYIELDLSYYIVNLHIYRDIDNFD